MNETPLIQNARKELAAYLAELAEKKANPFKGTALESFSSEIRTLRLTHRLSCGQIADKLRSLKIETTEDQVRAFCRRVLKIRHRITPKPRPVSP